MIELDGPIRPYAWGSRSFLAQLQGRAAPSPTPEAELWLGAHPDAPARANGTPLTDLIAADPRGVLGGSVLYQVAVPVLLGLAFAVLTGTGLAVLLQLAVQAPVRLDWLGIATTSGAAALVILLTTAASLPLLWRLMKPGGLRSE